MKDVSKYSEKIQKYLANELSVVEKVEFEQMVETNPKLQDEIRLYRKVNRAIADPSLENFKRELDVIHHQNFASGNHWIVVKYKQYFLVAALIIVLITAGYLLLFQSGSNDCQDVFAKFYQPIEVGVLRGIDVEADKYSQAVNAYNDAHYYLAFPQFERIVSDYSDNYAARLYLGICAIELDDFVTAKEQFNIIIKSKDVFYMQDAKWYMALLFLKMGEKHKAVFYFKAIKESDCVYALRASSALDELQ